MTPPIASFVTADGKEVHIEVAGDDRDAPVTRGLHPIDAATELVTSFEDAVAGIEAPIGSLISALESAAAGVNAIEVSFGLTIRAEAGAVITRVGGDANFQVTVHWAR